jgi:hypothetical protein
MIDMLLHGSMPMHFFDAQISIKKIILLIGSNQSNL